MTQKKYSSSLSWQSSETKSNLKLFLLCLELNKLNKQNVYEIKLVNKFKFFLSQNNCLHTFMARMKHKTLPLKISWNKHITLLSNANVPVRFRAQQYSSLQLKANCIAAIRCLRHYISIWFENHQPQMTQIYTVTDAPNHSKLESNGLQCWLQPQVFLPYSFNSYNIQGNIQAFRFVIK